ncbi:hypothetical protein CC86DRAFT_86649 [Ophiobolus disseminans]|uniref:Uncharacterized protein n=1 Tax=Ophiobolus disseminans TaxID=1469910 RepID=A0A6A7AGT5_9PLEO|nr:hypothetical protein CC86DRAFT_86649 [Ophiobolus disseminans]
MKSVRRWERSKKAVLVSSFISWDPHFFSASPPLQASRMGGGLLPRLKLIHHPSTISILVHATVTPHYAVPNCSSIPFSAIPPLPYFVIGWDATCDRRHELPGQLRDASFLIGRYRLLRDQRRSVLK